MFFAFLESDEARRASEVIEILIASGLRRCALTGGLAIEARLRAHGRPVCPRPLNDVDLVVEAFDAIPADLADRFLLNHIHPHAAEGKTLLQLVDRERALRIDLFRAFGATLSRASVLDEQTGPPAVLAVEDLVARTTALVCGRSQADREIDPKHVQAFRRLADLGDASQLAEAWEDHRQELPGSLEDAIAQTHRLLARRPDLVVSECYSAVVTACDRCQDVGPFRLARPEAVVDVLGYR